MNGGDMDDNVLFLGKGRMVTDMSVMEFFVGMALCRKGPLSDAQVAHDVSRWFDGPIGSLDLNQPLGAIVARGWARREQGLYWICEEGIEAVRGFYVGMVRLLDGGRGLLDVAVMLSVVREFEGRDGR